MTFVNAVSRTVLSAIVDQEALPFDCCPTAGKAGRFNIRCRLAIDRGSKIG
jgi:hypothetical protein